MLTIKSCTDTGHINALCEKTGVPFRQTVQAFCSEERGEETGCCLFSIKNGQAQVLRVCCGEDDFLEDGLIRAALSFCSQNGAEEFLLSPEIQWKTARRLGLDIHLTNHPRNIEEFFAKYKNCAR